MYGQWVHGLICQMDIWLTVIVYTIKLDLIVYIYTHLLSKRKKKGILPESHKLAGNVISHNKGNMNEDRPVLQVSVLKSPKYFQIVNVKPSSSSNP